MFIAAAAQANTLCRGETCNRGAWTLWPLSRNALMALTSSGATVHTKRARMPGDDEESYVPGNIQRSPACQAEQRHWCAPTTPPYRHSRFVQGVVAYLTSDNHVEGVWWGKHEHTTIRLLVAIPQDNRTPRQASHGSADCIAHTLILDASTEPKMHIVNSSRLSWTDTRRLHRLSGCAAAGSRTELL